MNGKNTQVRKEVSACFVFLLFADISEDELVMGVDDGALAVRFSVGLIG